MEEEGNEPQALSQGLAGSLNSTIHRYQYRRQIALKTNVDPCLGPLLAPPSRPFSKSHNLNG